VAFAMLASIIRGINVFENFIFIINAYAKFFHESTGFCDGGA
tara:strand:+ start:624 stop:749 length:126 start_codon:yes stop_codon:yes gene_type:complete